MPPQNRKQRRAAAAAEKEQQQQDSFDPSSIPLARPPANSERPAKTLFEIVAERQQELNQFVGNDDNKKKQNKNEKETASSSASLFDLDATETQFLEVSPSGGISSFKPDSSRKGDEEEASGEGLPPLIDTLLLSLPLTTVHLTLAFLAAHQYMQDINFKNLLRESTLIAFPVLTFCIHLAHGHIISFPWQRKSQNKNKNKSKAKTTKQPPPPATISSVIYTALVGDLQNGKTAFFLPLAIVLGSFLVRTTNEAGYYAVMKRAPSIGTMWVWCVLEISSPLAALMAVLVPLAWGKGIMGYPVY
ncbi:hypothetical protein UA08_03521 [Talaromyces atroroseus]|uniref:DUF7719 domain-containing protein n=1 Tax=Talaromyces atroroseus TaxID=1441469 RepID=A0A225AS03_TALAT|nr:hypothetical protein UA08_03521 [Talaromyces atroroseus]OKL61134.1 hypothetical protein UA08_03521 [Talaromyces atroroseus]